MPMTPDEYAAKEFGVDGQASAEPLYVPGYNPGENAVDPNILRILRDEAPTPAQEPHPLTEEMSFEYNFTLPLEQRRAEVLSETAKHMHLAARANFWQALATLITKWAK